MRSEAKLPLTSIRQIASSTMSRTMAIGGARQIVLAKEMDNDRE
jgi:hypothetical protein